MHKWCSPSYSLLHRGVSLVHTVHAHTLRCAIDPRCRAEDDILCQNWISTRTWWTGCLVLRGPSNKPDPTVATAAGHPFSLLSCTRVYRVFIASWNTALAEALTVYPPHLVTGGNVKLRPSSFTLPTLSKLLDTASRFPQGSTLTEYAQAPAVCCQPLSWSYRGVDSVPSNASVSSGSMRVLSASDHKCTRHLSHHRVVVCPWCLDECCSLIYRLPWIVSLRYKNCHGYQNQLSCRRDCLIYERI